MVLLSLVGACLPAQDFVPVAGFATFVNAFAVSSGTPAKSFNEYVDWVRREGGKSAVGIPAPASVPEFLVKVIGQKYKLDLVAAPYRGSAPMIGDMLGNQIPAGIASVPEFIENHKAGRMRVVAVLGGARQAAVPEVPTFAELGLAGFEDVPFYGFFAPAGTPQATVDSFGAALAKVIAIAEVRERMTTLGLTVGYMPQKQFAERERAYAQAWAGTCPLAADAVTASGSGLDPHISLKNAFLQAPRVAQARGIGTEVIERIIRANTEGRDFGVFGEPRVNVLKLNLALDRKM